MHARTLIAAAAAAVGAFAGCTTADEDDTAASGAAPPPEAEPAAAEPTAVTVTATDYAFDMPAELEAGLVTFEMPNRGKEIHHAQLVRLNPGADFDDALAALTEEDLETFFQQVSVVGGVGIVPPDSSAASTVNLEAGDYALICGIPSEDDGVPHFAKGMVSQFTVTGQAPVATPRLDTVGEVTLDDFAFGLPDDLEGTLAVTNTGEQPHEMLLVQLAEGVSLEDALAALEGPPPTDGPPPAIPAGGMQALMPGDTGYLDLSTLAPGRYGLVCFVPDPASGKPHVELGMVDEIEIDS